MERIKHSQLQLTKTIFFCLVTIMAMVSCKKSTTHPTNTASAVDVFVVGDTKFSPGISTATIWKNGVRILLNNDTTTSYSRAFSIANNNGDIYVAGVYNNNAVYWKNGNMISLGIFSNGSYVNSVAAAPDGMVMTGIGTTTRGNAFITCWKNDVRLKMDLDSINQASIGSAVAVNGNDLYVCGGTVNIKKFAEAPVIWKNGSMTSLYSFSTINNFVTSIVIFNNDIYTAGYSTDTIKNIQQPVIWKNGVIQVLPGTVSTSAVNALAINGNDVYAGGQMDYNAVYWKNGVSTILAKGTVDIQAQVDGIAISGDNIYASGTVGEQAVYWENGKMTVLGKGEATKILLIPHK